MENVHKIFGAPGCGKTTRIIAILTEELKTTPPNRIAFVSFTRKGTYEGVERAKVLYGLKDADLPYFRTLHSIAFREGEYAKYDMISKLDYKEFSEALAMKFTGYYTEEFYNNDDKYLFVHFLKRNNPRMAQVYEDSVSASCLRDVETNYARFKKHKNVHDFTDIIERFVEAGEALPVDVAIIDEAQDLTTLQWRMCEVAFSNCKRVYVAGDDDQAIYEWSGADVDYFLNLPAVNNEILGKSYRLQRQTLDVAKRVAHKIKHRVDKAFDPLSDQGTIRAYNSLEDLDIAQGETWYFLSRNNWFLSVYREFLKKRAKVFVDKDSLSFDQREVDAINAYEAARKRGKMTDIEEVKLKLFLKEDAQLSKPWFESLNFDAEQTTYYRDLVRTKAQLKDRSITVNTIHGVKGGEADNVVLMLDYTRAVSANMERNPDAELRCLYVALTRAKKNLHIVYSHSKTGYDSIMREALNI
jgi:superfamily I DNA/RNA helicase